MILYNLNHQIIGTGSFKQRTLKYVAVAPEFRETTAFAQIVTYLTDKILETQKHCFVFTKPETAKLFIGLGFTKIADAEPLYSVLEFGFKTIADYQKYLIDNKIETKTDKIAAIVVNCNPITRGHLYLIEKAAAENELVYLFVVKEDMSAFPFKLRWKLIEKSIAHLKNVKMLSSGQYIVSGSIFPNYFLKNESWNHVSQKQAEVDVKVFAQYVVPILKIKKRYVGTENYCQTTAAYNRAMHIFLPKAGVEVVEITRKAIGTLIDDEPNFISASKVRAAIKNDAMDEIIGFLPLPVKEFLLSPESEEVRRKIKESSGRH
jgi:[citrate (pro-3S)-lyase] ligase